MLPVMQRPVYSANFANHRDATIYSWSKEESSCTLVIYVYVRKSSRNTIIQVRDNKILQQNMSSIDTVNNWQFFNMTVITVLDCYLI